MSTTAEDLKRRIQQAGTSATALRERIAQASQTAAEPSAPTSVPRAMGRGAVSRFVDNIFGLPDLAVTAGARILTGRPLIDRKLERPEGYTEEQWERLNTPLVNLPPVGARVIPGMPRGDDVLPGGAARSAELQEAHPVAFALGELAGDGATVLTGRAAPVRAVERGRGMINMRAGVMPPKAAPNLQPGMRAVLDNAMKSDAGRWIGKVVGRAGETGFEGAVLAALDEGDPASAAAYSAGAQAAGTGLLSMTASLGAGPKVEFGLRLGMAALAVGSIMQIGAEATPGGRNHVLESWETGYEKVLGTLALGAMAGAAGFGRVTSKNMPVLADAVQTLPRASTLTLMRQVLDENERGGTTTQHALTVLLNDPGRFSKNQLAQLNRAYETGMLPQTIARMSDRDAKFRELLNAPIGE